MTKPRIRLARLADLGRLVDIDRQCFPQGIAFDAGHFRACLLNPRARTHIAQVASGVAGFSVTELDESDRSGILVTLDVLPAWRRQGVASRLLAASEAWLLDCNARELVLQVATSNEAALGFYLRRDFRIIRTLGDYYGRGNDAFLMRKGLLLEG